MTNLDSVLRSRDFTLPTKVHIVKAMVFPVVMYGCDSWTVKKAECRRIDVFELWCWRRLLRVPWTAADPTSPSWWKSVLNIHWKDWYWSWNSSILVISCKQLLMEKSLMLGKFEGKSRWVCQRMKWLNAITNATDMNLGKLQGMVRDREAWRTAAPGVAKSRTRLATEPQQQLFNVVSVSSFLHVIL